MEVIYLTFNEGFHSTNTTTLIREDLCGEAIRLCKLLIKKNEFRSGSLYALFALLCFHASRLKSKTNEANEIVDIREQDRSQWHFPLIELANRAMNKAMQFEDVSIYHYEAAIAAEHVKAKTFEETDWQKILKWYAELQKIRPSSFSLLNIAIVNLQLNNFEVVKEILEKLPISELEQREYLYYGCYSEYYTKTDNPVLAISHLDTAISMTSNQLEKGYLQKKKRQLEIRSPTSKTD